jgi:hypothetical protein
LSEGVRADTAETFVKNRAIRTTASNARSEKTKLIMEAGNFPNLHDAVTKFITVDSDFKFLKCSLYKFEKKLQ